MPETFFNKKMQNENISSVLFLKNFSIGELIFLLMITEGKSLIWHSKKCNVTYAHTSKTFKKLEKLGVIRTEKQKRERVVFINPEFKNILFNMELNIRKFLEMLKPQFSKENMKKWKLLL